jgi:hypothetical protein
MGQLIIGIGLECALKEIDGGSLITLFEGLRALGRKGGGLFTVPSLLDQRRGGRSIGRALARSTGEDDGTGRQDYAQGVKCRVSHGDISLTVLHHSKKATAREEFIKLFPRRRKP